MRQSMIREATPADVDQIVHVVNAAYRPVPGAEGWTHESVLVTGDRVTTEQVAHAIEHAQVLVALCDSHCVGCVQIEASGRVAHIGMLAVLPTYQTAGLGKELLAAAEQYAQLKLRAAVFELLVVAQRRELIDFYLRRGYEETSRHLTYPVEAGVGKPIHAEICLVVLRKCSGEPGTPTAGTPSRVTRDA